MLKEKKIHHLRILYVVKLYLTSEGEMKPFSDELKWNKIITSIPTVQEMFKDFFPEEGKPHRSETWIYIKKGKVLEKE